jgi:hypothetical protein
VTVWLRAGTYELSEPLAIGPEDSPRDNATVSYGAWAGERVVVSGGQRLAGWKALSPDRWVVEVPGVKEGRWHPRQLFVNGTRRTRARSPASGFHRGLKFDDARRVVFPAGVLRLWDNPEDVELVTFVEWTPSRVRLGKLDLTRNAAEFNVPIIQFFDQPWGQHIRGNARNFPFFFENAKEMLDAPGQWHLDRRSGVLTYLPQRGERIERADAVLPRLEQLLVVRGKPERPVRNLHFRGITFSHTDWQLPANGFFPDQAGFFDTENAKRGLPVPAAAIDLQHAHHCTLEDCRMEGLGGHALRLREGCKSNSLSACAIEDVGGNGISLGLFDRAATEADAVGGNVVRDCTIRRCGLEHAGCVGVWVGIARETTIAHNELSELPYAGISCGWRWDRTPVGCRRNVIRHNHLHHVAQLLADTGGIYLLGDQPGGAIRGNYIHHIARFSGLAANNGIFFDNGSRGWRVEDNVIHDVEDGAIRHNDNRHEDHSWGMNYCDVRPGDAASARGITARAGPERTRPPKDTGPESLPIPSAKETKNERN